MPLAALYKGDTRKRTIDIYVDDAKITTWTSSGTTAGFESVGLDTQGQVIELRAVLAGSDWLSIVEVRALPLPSSCHIIILSGIVVGAGELRCYLHVLFCDDINHSCRHACRCSPTV